MAPLALVLKLATRVQSLHCHIALNCPIALALSVILRYPHQPESHQLSFTKVAEGHPDPKIGPQVYLGPIKSVIIFK